MARNIVEGVVAAACHVRKTAPCYKGYQAALLLQILITEKNSSDQLWEQEDKQRIMGVSYCTKQRALSLDRWTVVFL